MEHLYVQLLTNYLTTCLVAVLTHIIQEWQTPAYA
jgi:hypothetical protein